MPFADKGFNGLALDAVLLLDDIDEFDIDRDRVIEQTAQVCQQFFELCAVILASLDDFDDDEISAYLYHLEFLQEMEVLLDVHGEGVQKLQRGDEFSARQDEAIVSPALEGLEYWETDPTGTCGVAVCPHVADAVADERHGGASCRRQHDLPHFPRTDFLTFRVDELHPHVIRKDVVVVVSALGGNHPGLFRGVFVVDGAVEGFGDEISLILGRELRVDPDKFGPDVF